MSNPVGAQRYGLGGGDAYYDAVKYGGYTGTREQFGRDQAEFAQNATAVAQAKEEVERNTQTVVNTAQTFTEETVPAAIQSVEEKGDTEEDRLEARTTELVQSVNTAGAVQVQAVRDEGTEQIRLVSGAGTAQVEAVEQAGSDQVDAVEAAGSTQVGNVNNAGTTQVGNVNNAGSTQISAVNSEGSTQVQAVQDKGTEVLNSIPSDYTELTEDVDNLKTAINEKYDMVAMRTYNLFDKTNAEVVKEVTGGIENQNDNARTVIIPVTVTNQTSITVTKTVPSSRFSIAVFNSKPVIGDHSVTYAVNNAATSLSVNVSSSIKYLAVYFWLATADTNITPEEVLDGLMVEFGNKFTKYVEPYQPINQPQLNNLEDVIAYPKGTDIPLTFVSATGYYTQNGGFSTYEGVQTATISVNANEKYILTSRNYYNAAPAVFFDSNNTVVKTIWNANNTNMFYDLVVEVPENATSLMIQRFYGWGLCYIKLYDGIKPTPPDSILKGKKLTFIGDSITESNFRAKTNWAFWIMEWCQANVQNLGMSGTGFRAGVSSNKNYYARISSIQQSPDIIGVALSFNDIANSSVNIGTVNDTTSDDTVAGYANDFFDALITAFPTTPIICYVQSPWSSLRFGNQRSDTWVELCKQICELKGIPFYDDLYHGTVLKPWIADNRTVYYTSDTDYYDGAGTVDDAHPNSEGHKVIARTLYPLFAKNIVATGLDYFN